MRTVLGWMLSGPLGRKETKVPTSNFIDTTADLSKKISAILNLRTRATNLKCQCHRTISAR